MTEVCVVCVAGRVVETMDVRPEGRQYLTRPLPPSSPPCTRHGITSPRHLTHASARHATPRHATLSDEYTVCLSVSVLVQHDYVVRIDDKREREVREVREVREEREQEKESFHVDSIL